MKVTRAPAVVVSEEGSKDWRPRCEKWCYGDNVFLYCRPFAGKPTLDDWRRLVSEIARSRATDNIELVVIDSLTRLLPNWKDNEGAAVKTVLSCFHLLARIGMAVLILHDPRETPALPQLGACPGLALGSYVDIVMEMQPWGRVPGDRRRRLRSFSRFEPTHRDLAIELNRDGCDYKTLGAFEQADFGSNWPDLYKVLSSAPRPWTRHEIRNAWPQTESAPSPISLWRWLKTAVDKDLVQIEPANGRNKFLRYRVAGSTNDARTP